MCINFSTWISLLKVVLVLSYPSELDTLKNLCVWHGTDRPLLGYKAPSIKGVCWPVEIFDFVQLQ
jgi:hypothetical protein